MAHFTDTSETWERLDWQILQNSSVALYHDTSIFTQDMQWFQTQSYQVYHFNCTTWTTLEAFHTHVQTEFEFPGYYGGNMDALNDCLSEIRVPNESGTVLSLSHFDCFTHQFPRVAYEFLDIIGCTSRMFLLFGQRFLALVHTDDPDVHFDAIGACPVIQNPREHLFLKHHMK